MRSRTREDPRTHPDCLDLIERDEAPCLRSPAPGRVLMHGWMNMYPVDSVEFATELRCLRPEGHGGRHATDRHWSWA